MTSIHFRTKLSLAAAAAVAALSGCAELNDPYYGGGGYPSGGYSSGSRAPYNSGYRDPYYGSQRDPYYNRDRYDRDHYREERELERERERARRERERAEDAREAAERERRRLEELRRHESDYRRPPAPPPAQVEHCPSGYSETNRKCTDAERKKGCSDIKMPGGKRCIRL